MEQWLDWNQCRLAPAVIDIVRNKMFGGGDTDAIARGERKLQELVPILEAGLEGKAFLAGATPTIADLSVGSSVFQLGLAGFVPATASLAGWYRRVLGIDGFRQSLPPSHAS